MERDLFEEVTRWQKNVFKDKINTFGLLTHLVDEAYETQSAVKHNDPDKRLEFADCFILLMGAAKADGMSYEDICQAIKEKLEINKKRVWNEPDSNGVINHIKQ